MRKCILLLCGLIFSTTISAQHMPTNKAKSLQLLVGTYTVAESKGIYGLSFNPQTGQLSQKTLLAEEVSPTYLYISQDGERVYSVNRTQPGSVSAFRWNENKTQLEKINSQSVDGNGACYVQQNAQEDLIAVANYVTGNIALFPVHTDGRILPDIQSKKHMGNGPVLPNQKSAHAHCVKFDDSGKYLYAADLGIDKTLVYPIDKTGKLGEATVAFAADAGDGPRHLIFHPKENKAFIINELSSTVVSVHIHPQTGIFEKIDKKSTLPADFSGKNSCADIHLGKNGKYLYASNRGHNSIAIFSVAPDGSLDLLANEPVRGDWPRNFTLSPDGDFLLVANKKSDNITVFKVDPDSGLLSFTGHEIKISQPVCLKFK